MHRTDQDREWDEVVAACWDINYKPPVVTAPARPEVQVSTVPESNEVDLNEPDTGMYGV